MLLLNHRFRILMMPRCCLLTVCPIGLAVAWYAMWHDRLVPWSGRRGGRSRCNGMSAVERVEGRMGMIDAIHDAISAVLRVGRRRGVRGRGSMHSGRHDAVQFGIAAYKDGGGCTRIAPSLQHRCSAQYPQTYAGEDAHGLETYRF